MLNTLQVLIVVINKSSSTEVHLMKRNSVVKIYCYIAQHINQDTDLVQFLEAGFALFRYFLSYVSLKSFPRISFTAISVPIDLFCSFL